MGDVPASMLYLESPEAVAAYCARLVHELGPNGFILQSGCDIPANARLENVKAMVAAAVGNGAESMAHSGGDYLPVAIRTTSSMTVAVKYFP